MKDVTFVPLGKTSPKKTTKEAYPDTGAKQSIVWADLVGPMGLRLKRGKSKMLEAVDGGVVQCDGSAAVEVHYQGHQTTTKLKNEVILSKTVLQDLEVIIQDFPNIINKLRPT